MTLTTQQVETLAPDPASLKAGRGLATTAKWVSTGRDTKAAWGECKGSGAQPYRVEVDFSGLASKCSCPSRKFPCKHAIGLMLILAERAREVPEAAQPQWVAEWLEKRVQAAEKKLEKAAQANAPTDPEAFAKRQAAQEKRAARREELVAAGVDELERFLSDTVRSGLAAARQQGRGYWLKAATRMVDAQTPGLARMLRRCGDAVLLPDERWTAAVVDNLSAIHLVAQGYRRFEHLPADLAADVRSAIGWTVQEADVLISGEHLRDTWNVAARQIQEEDGLRVCATWLWGTQSRRRALVLKFAAGAQALDLSLLPGTGVDGEVAFYPSASPLRALPMGDFAAAAKASLDWPELLEDNFESYRTAIAACPWIERYLFLLRRATLRNMGSSWVAVDQSGVSVPIDPAFQRTWELMCCCGTSGVPLAGVWDGSNFMPLTAISDGITFMMGETR